MIRNEKKLLIILTSSLLTLNMVSVASFATTKQIYIDDLDQLKSVLQQDTAIEDINNNVAPAVATEFMEEKMDQAAEIINGEAFTVNMQRQVDGSLYGKLSFNLGDGCELIVELSDKSEAQEHFDISRAAVSTSDSQWLGYGKRQFMAKTSVKCPVGTVYMNLTNRYTLSADGIDERSGAATCSWSNLGGIITHTDPKITDGIARTPGASDVNMHCDYTLKGSTTGKGERQSEYRLNTAVGYLDINTATKKIKVRQSWNLIKIS